MTGGTYYFLRLLDCSTLSSLRIMLYWCFSGSFKYFMFVKDTWRIPRTDSYSVRNNIIYILIIFQINLINMYDWNGKTLYHSEWKQLRKPTLVIAD